MEQFEGYFQRADTDRDGRISGAEAVAFFQGSNLSKQVLAQIWMHADQSHTGYLGRQEFYNALKLVTVAQSKRELTPDIANAALYGPASAKIPAPQINLATISVPLSNQVAAASVPQMGTVAPMATQNFGVRGQVPTNASMNQQYFPSQGSQAVRPPLSMPTGSASRLQGVGGPDFPRGASMVGPGLPNSNISSDWFGGRTGGASTGATSQVPNRGISPSIATVSPKPQDPLSTSSSMAARDPKAPLGSGNGFASDQMFGGDVFSATQSLPKQVYSGPTYSASSALVSSAIVPTTGGPMSSVKPDPFELLPSSLTRQSTGNQIQPALSLSKPNQQVSGQSASTLASSGMIAEVSNSTSNQSQHPWPKMTRAGVQKYMKVFLEVDTDRDGKITGEQARNLFLSWRLPRGKNCFV
ncbi:unnamed protein product [Ilex paraguariensis]|uniref:Uncharacterized protein n=1 Tax=Ilex paraguariensis TaxID=185542 RepID=A0ABC8TTN1_9AQUA